VLLRYRIEVSRSSDEDAALSAQLAERRAEGVTA
jgi:hypothetical protein